MNTQNITKRSLLAAMIAIMLTIGPSLAVGQTSKLVTYTVTDLGTLQGGASSFGFDMNNAGWVAGSATLPGSPNQHAVLWYYGQPIDLGTLGGPNSEAGGPNSSLVAALISETALTDPNNEDFCGFGDHLQCLAAIWKYGDSAPTALPTIFGGNNSQAYGINDRGQVVGFAENATFDPTCATPFQVRRFVPVIWGSNGKLRQLQPLQGDTVGFAFGINDRGQAVGGSGQCSDTTLPPMNPSAPHAVRWENDGSSTDLGNLGGATSLASAINNRGDVDGAAQMPDGAPHAFLWTEKGKINDLGTLSGDFMSVAPCCNTINDSRQVVGFSIGEAGPRAFLWQNGAMTDLNDIAPGSPLYLLFAQAINSSGQITGLGMTGTGDIHAFLATPNN